MKSAISWNTHETCGWVKPKTQREKYNGAAVMPIAIIDMTMNFMNCTLFSPCAMSPNVNRRDRTYETTVATAFAIKNAVVGYALNKVNFRP